MTRLEWTEFILLMVVGFVACQAYHACYDQNEAIASGAFLAGIGFTLSVSAMVSFLIKRIAIILDNLKDGL